jgi:hypothetical protein
MREHGAWYILIAWSPAAWNECTQDVRCSDFAMALDATSMERTTEETSE